jgi:hypothetical protein
MKFLLLVMVAVCLPACGSGSGGGSTTPPGNNEWAWMSGSNVDNQTGTYGIQGNISMRHYTELFHNPAFTTIFRNSILGTARR